MKLHVLKKLFHSSDANQNTTVKMYAGHIHLAMVCGPRNYEREETALLLTRIKYKVMHTITYIYQGIRYTATNDQIAWCLHHTSHKPLKMPEVSQDNCST